MSGNPRILVLFGNVPLHGQERANIEALDALQQTGCEVLFLIRKDWTKDTIQPELNRRGLKFVFVPYFDAFRYNMRIRVWWNNLTGIAGGSWQLLRQIRSLRATHIHVGSVSNVLNFLPALLLTRLPLIFRAGDVPIMHHWLWRMVWRFVVWRAAHFVAISHFIHAVLVKAGVESENISLIYNAPPGRGKEDALTLPQSAASGLTYVYIGQLSPEKGLSELVDAAIMHSKRYPDSLFLIAGAQNVRSAFCATLTEKVSLAGATDSVHFLGYVSAIKQVLARADVHVCPSVWEEPLSNVVMEAKQAGVLSVIFRSGGLQELVIHGVDGYVCSEKNAACLANAFAFYEQNRPLISSQGKAALASLERFGTARFAQNWRTAYNRPKHARPSRILVLFGNVPLYGQERANIEALDALQQTGCEVLFLIRKDWTKDTIQPELNRRGLKFVFVPYFDAFRYNMRIRVWWNNLTGIAGGSWQLLRQIRSLRATHIHVGSVSNVLNFLPALLLTRLPLIFRAGDVPTMHHWLWRMVWRFSCWRAAHFVCDSKFIQNELLATGIEKERTTVVYPPAPTRTEQSTRDNARSWEAKQISCFTVLYAGQITVEKGVEVLFESAVTLCHQWADIRFLIAGDYSWNNPLGAKLHAHVRELRLEDQIVFVGFVEDIQSLYRSANLHVCPSLCQEALGLTVMEAKEHSVPSVVFPSGGLIETVQHGVDGCICENVTAAALTAAISDYYLHPDVAVDHGIAARASLLRLGVDRFSENLREIYG